MKTNILLVADDAEDSIAIIADAAARTGRGLRQAKNTRCAFDLVTADLDDIDLIIIDLDPGRHSMSALEALGCCKICPPIIVVTGLEERQMTKIAFCHGASACIAKPFSAAELASAINKTCGSISQPTRPSCDLWGHPLNSRKPISSAAA